VPTFIGIGFSKTKDPFTASKEAALSAKLQTKQERIDLLLVFTSINYSNEEIIRGIMEATPPSLPPLVGCSSGGLILSRGVQKEGVLVLAITSDEIKFGLGFCEEINPTQERLSGSEVARNTVKNFGSHKRHLFMLISDGLIKNGSEVIRGVQEAVGKSFPFIGGTSSDDLTFSKTYQYFHNRILTNSVVGVLWGGEMNFGLGIKHGWKPLGKPHTATDTEGNIIKKIDDQPAIKIYEDYFGKETQDLLSNKLARMTILYPIGIYVAGEKEYLLRNTLGVNAEGHLICQGEVPVDSEIRLMIGSKESCLAATREAAMEAMAGLSDRTPLLLLIFDSISRRKLLGRDMDKEIEIIREVFGEKVPMAGFYTFGEEAPLKSLDYEGQSYFHNETIAILAIAK
jgi:hypothetical protein